jgi:hypothetical protein
VPLVLVAEVATNALAEVLTGSASDAARDTAADALRWMVPAACAQLFAALAASGLAALDDYATAAFAYAAGSLGGLALILARVDADGIIAVAWGMVLNGAIVLAVTAGGLLIHASRERVGATALRPTGPPLLSRLGAFAVSASLPLALQLLYVVCLPFASRLGTGAATTFVYAYLGAAALVTVTASSLALVTSVPLARDVLNAEVVTRHVAASSWIALGIVAPGAGILAVAGGDVFESILGGAYGGEIGAELGRLVALLTPWVVAAVGVALTFPLLFIVGKTGWLPVVAVTAVLVQIPLAWAGEELFELEGLAVSLAVTTWAILAALLARLAALEATLLRLVRIAAGVGLLVLVAYALPALVLDPVVAAVVGSVVYVVLLAVLRPAGLRASWRYLHGLG